MAYLSHFSLNIGPKALTKQAIKSILSCSFKSDSFAPLPRHRTHTYVSYAEDRGQKRLLNPVYQPCSLKEDNASSTAGLGTQAKKAAANHTP